MKKSEKAKGKERAKEKKRQTTLYLVVGVIAFVVVAAVLFFALNPPVAKTGDSVSVLYVGTLENGSVFDNNVNSTPLTFTIGSKKVIPGFEEAVIGMSRGQVRTVHIPVDKAYGEYRKDLVMVVNRSLFPASQPPLIGRYYSFTDPATGSPVYARVVSVTGDGVTIDQNHMLAGQNLTFMIRLVSINEAEK